ncbi:uncharacterized protein B0I36DRAFT_326501 [Microdochium trichocladiopsis]|uniref:SRPBCC domain-containing protein n=1 Tax=Microdochium trichocladiopsis TaxID=1682393 RepID=A0A9P8Y550_9PEZI|nr:uncharacterized protein B0I36DRAFT_326501 [Microdochium trichocladiopsis]KAH7029913.1 hypothetical protein B0I36DRAFT_326501 [Microdochium trichocladiopsis]
MVRIENSVFIAAPASTVWAIITDFASYGEWNSFITAVASPVPLSETTVGTPTTITVAPTQPGGKPAQYHNTISVFNPGREMRWWGTMVHSAIFRAEHWCTLEETTVDGVKGTKFTQGEKFTGCLPPLANALSSAFKDLEQGHLRMNAELKRYAEGK